MAVRAIFVCVLKWSFGCDRSSPTGRNAGTSRIFASPPIEQADAAARVVPEASAIGYRRKFMRRYRRHSSHAQVAAKERSTAAPLNEPATKKQNPIAPKTQASAARPKAGKRPRRRAPFRAKYSVWRPDLLNESIVPCPSCEAACDPLPIRCRRAAGCHLSQAHYDAASAAGSRTPKQSSHPAPRR